MKNDLACRTFIVDDDIDPVGLGRFFDADRKVADHFHDGREDLVREAVDILDMSFRDDQGVTLVHRCDIQKSQHILILIDFHRRDLVANDLAENTIVHDG